VAVAALQQGVDPVGCCVGLRGIRIQNIANELNGEKIDVVMWNPDVATFIASALSPAQILDVESNEDDVVATVVVPDRQLSLAIGKEGQNVRLAAKLTGWRIDIKSASVAEVEKEEAAKAQAESAEEEEVIPVEISLDEIPVVLEPVLPSAEVEVVEAVEEAEETEPMPSLDTVFTPPLSESETLADKKPSLRFAEDILSPGPAKPQAKAKKKKKKGQREQDTEEDRSSGVRKSRRDQESLLDASLNDSIDEPIEDLVEDSIDDLPDDPAIEENGED
jgi:N utilization substance protein A